ncbi:MAG TPA: AbiV family abortive infection protein [Puia sp.]|jgi:AbiV family abortive infection protein|nr:AbiV family abortive infection protein [Puia sp.]
MSDSNFHKEGYELAISKAQSLLKIADISAYENEYGIACSLNVLAAEEAKGFEFEY